MKHFSPFAQMKHISAFDWEMAPIGSQWAPIGSQWAHRGIPMGPHGTPVGPFRSERAPIYDPRGTPSDRSDITETTTCVMFQSNPLYPVSTVLQSSVTTASTNKMHFLGTLQKRYTGGRFPTSQPFYDNSLLVICISPAGMYTILNSRNGTCREVVFSWPGTSGGSRDMLGNDAKWGNGGNASFDGNGEIWWKMMKNDVISLVNGENGTRPTPFPAPECLTGADSKWW